MPTLPSDSRHVLMTGASGLVGTAVAEALANDGHSITVVSRQKDPAPGKSIHPTITWSDLDALSTLPRPLDAVIHLAGEPIFGVWTKERKRRIRESRVNTTEGLATALARLEKKPSVLVCASAIGYYGDRSEEILAESSHPGTGFLAETCIAWEKAADAARQAGIRVVHVRIGIVLSLKGGALPVMSPAFRLGLGGRIGSGWQWMSWIELSDLVNILKRATADPALDGAVNGVSPNPVTNSDFTRTLASALHRPAVLPVPELLVKMLPGGMGRETLLSSARVVPEKMLTTNFAFKHPLLDETLRTIMQSSRSTAVTRP